MHLGTVRVGPGVTRAAVREGDAWVLLNAPDVGDLIRVRDWRERVRGDLATGERVPVTAADLAAPVLRPAKIICCGLNYRDHIAEMGREPPEYPTLFAKFAETLTGPADDIEIAGSAQVDWEAELAVIVGHALYRADRETAAASILGYTVANDVSCRDWQHRTLQWFQGKTWEGSTPLGPAIVTADEIDPQRGLEIRCEVDGVTMQASHTSELVFDAATLLSYISQFMRLGPGDVVLTGTPGGVGSAADPPRWLRDGEFLTTTIDGIGSLTNIMRLRADTGSPAQLEQETET